MSNDPGRSVRPLTTASRNAARQAIHLRAAHLRTLVRQGAVFPVAALGVASLLLATGATRSTADSGDPVLLVAWPQAELSLWQDADGVPGRRFFDLCRRDGWILHAAELSEKEAERIDLARLRAGEDLFWRTSAGSGGGLLVLGRGDGAVHLRWEGILPAGDPGRLEEESRAWLPSTRRMRWEEVVEVLDLTAGENRAFQAQRADGGPLAPLRAAYLQDKTSANLSIYLAGTRRPRALVWSLALTEAFERALVPLVAPAGAAPSSAPADRPEPALSDSTWADPELLDAARRRLFVLRLLASRSRAYGRCDRILLSLSAESPRGTWLLVDARDSNDPFVAVARVGERLEPAAGRGDSLLRLLDGALP